MPEERGSNEPQQFCENCGAQLETGHRFCVSCGERAVPELVSSGQPYVRDAESQGKRKQTKNFLQALFDISFSEFVTTRLIKVLYVLGIIFYAIVTIIWLLLALNGVYTALLTGFYGVGEVLLALLALVLALVFYPLFFLFSVIVLRVLLELVVVIFRIAESARDIARREETRR